MGNNVVDEADLIIRVSGEQAGGKKGQVIMSDVTLSGTRDNTYHSGIGNRETQATKYGVEQYAFDTEQILNKAAARMLVNLIKGGEDADEVIVRAPDVLEARGGRLDWEDWEITATDEGDVTLSISGALKGVSLDTLF